MTVIENPKRETWSDLLKRPTQSVENVEDTVNQIFDDVKRNGDKAIDKYTALFDGVEMTSNQVSREEIDAACSKVPAKLKQAIHTAKSNIETFHKAQITERVEVETMPGVKCWQEKRAIDKIGLYIPGGTAPLFSTVLMLAVPAQIAGCH